MYGVDLEYMIMALLGASAVLLILVIILFAQLSSLKKKYESFMKGEDGKSLEDQVKANYHTMKSIELKQQQQDLDILDISDRADEALSKVSIVKYDAFHGIGGKLSFALTVLNEKKNGYIINCMHSNHGSYVYSKEIRHGACEVELSKEEQESLNKAM